MKVLHLISGGDKGGAKTHVFALLSALMNEIDVKIICFMEGVFYQEISKMPIPSLLIKQKYRNDLTVVPKLVSHIREERYELIHAHGARANFIAVMLRPFIKTPMITTIHSDYLLDFTENLYKKMVFTQLNSFSLRFIDYYIAVSDNFKDMLVKRNFEADKIYSVYNAIDFRKETVFMSKETFLKQHNINADGKTLVGIIGRFDEVKGHAVFLRAAAKVLEKRTDVLFMLAGEGVLKSELEALAETLGISKNVAFMGFIDDIFSFINAIDINVLTSHSESFPYVLLEGAKMSKATVSTAVGGIPDLIIHEKTGLLAEAGDYEGIAKHIVRLIDERIFRTSLGENLYKHASSNFSTDVMRERHVEIYNEVISRHKQGGMLFDVMLSGYYGFNNSGDDAILSAIIDCLRAKKPDISIAVLSKSPKVTATQYNVTAINRIDFLQIAKFMNRTRVFINGGGSLIQDITSTHSLIYYTLLMKYAKRLGLKLMLYANGIGPIIKKSNLSTAKQALTMCDYITLREPESFDELKRLEVQNENVTLSSDPTLSISPINGAQLEEILKVEGIDRSKNYVAISFRQWKYKDIDFVAKMASVINKVNLHHGLIPLFIPMQHPFDDIISRDVMQKLTCESVILKSEYSVRELMGIIGVCKLVIGMRLHALIYAVSVSVPILGIVYDPKIEAFMKYIGQKYYVDNSNIDSKKMIKMVNEIMTDPEKVIKSISKEADRLRELGGKDADIAISLI